MPRLSQLNNLRCNITKLEKKMYTSIKDMYMYEQPVSQINKGQQARIRHNYLLYVPTEVREGLRLALVAQ